MTDRIVIERTKAANNRLLLLTALDLAIVSLWLWFYLNEGGWYDLAMLILFGLLFILRLRVRFFRPLVAEISDAGLVSHGFLRSKFAPWEQITWAVLDDSKRAGVIAFRPTGKEKDQYMGISMRALGERVELVRQALDKYRPGLPNEQPDPTAATFD